MATNKKAAKYNIQILRFASDGDTRLMKTMRECLLYQNTLQMWKWFQMDLPNGDLCIQDTVHVGTKMITRLLNSKVEIKMGHYLA